MIHCLLFQWDTAHLTHSLITPSSLKQAGGFSFALLVFGVTFSKEKEEFGGNMPAPHIDQVKLTWQKLLASSFPGTSFRNARSHLGFVYCEYKNRNLFLVYLLWALSVRDSINKCSGSSFCLTSFCWSRLLSVVLSKHVCSLFLPVFLLPKNLILQIGRRGNADNVFNKQINEYSAKHGQSVSIPKQNIKLTNFTKPVLIFIIHSKPASGLPPFSPHL